MEEMSRRGFIGRGGAFVGALGLAGIVPFEALAAPAGALTPERRQSYLALVEALSCSTTIAVDQRRASEFADALAEQYEAAEDASRQAVDLLLDSLDYDGDRHRKGSFAGRGKQERLKVLRDRVNDHRPLDSDRALERGWCVRHAAGLVLSHTDDNVTRYGPWTFEI